MGAVGCPGGCGGGGADGGAECGGGGGAALPPLVGFGRVTLGSGSISSRSSWLIFTIIVPNTQLNTCLTRERLVRGPSAEFNPDTRSLRTNPGRKDDGCMASLF